MQRKLGLASACAGLILVGGALAACGGSSGGNGGGPADSGELADGGEDGFVPPTEAGGDSSMGNPDSGQPVDSGKPDAPDGGCDFNAFVIGLITNHTNNTDSPSTDLGQNCTDTHTPFPNSLF